MRWGADWLAGARPSQIDRQTGEKQRVDQKRSLGLKFLTTLIHLTELLIESERECVCV